MKQIIGVLLILILAAALVGCRDIPGPSDDIKKTEPNIAEPKEPSVVEPNEPSTPEIMPPPPADSFEIVGTVRYKSIEGGFYAIDGDDGRKYDPMNLPESFRKDGLRVKVTARPRRDAVSIHMYGAIIEVVNIAAQ